MLKVRIGMLIGLATAFAAAALAQSGDWPKTKAEATNFAQTSSYADVIAFLDALKAHNPPMKFTYIGKSPLGKDMPLVIVAKDPNITPQEAKEQGKLVVYIQANIHAGEVEGKEATLQFLRELAQNPKDKLLDKMVFVVDPIYNIDGNDKFGPANRNRGAQDGPDPVGERANGQGFDLNRDCMKAESNEFRAILEHVYVKWDPIVCFDLHTTDGTRHGYAETYSPPLNPTTPESILRYSRDELLVTVRDNSPSKHGWRLFDYGNTERRGDDTVFATFGYEPRYCSNYAGIRNRIPILSEAASFQPFELRVKATYAFLRDCLEKIDKDSERILRMAKNADNQVIAWGSDPAKAPELGVRFEMVSRGKENVLLEDQHADDRVAGNKAPKYFKTVEMDVLDRFKTTRTTKFPGAYLIPSDSPQVARLLMRHGVEVIKLDKAWSGNAEDFEISECNVAPNPFQGHRLIRLEGKFRSTQVTFPAGSFLVKTAQPLGILVFNLLEPESMDGVACWGLLGEKLEVGSIYPISKIMKLP